jgi:death on curing protein
VSGTWLEAEDLLRLLAEHTGAQARVRDGGILVAVAARHRARLVGTAIYPTAVDQAAALLHGIVAWRPLDLWNGRLGWGAVDTHLEWRGLVLNMPTIERIQLTDDLMTGSVDSVEEAMLRIAPYVEAIAD